MDFSDGRISRHLGPGRQDAGRLSDAGARLLGVARGLADQAGAQVTALLAGPPPAGEDDSLGRAVTAAIAYGADAALHVARCPPGRLEAPRL